MPGRPAHLVQEVKVGTVCAGMNGSMSCLVHRERIEFAFHFESQFPWE